MFSISRCCQDVVFDFFDFGISIRRRVEFIGFQEIHVEFLRSHAGGKKRLFDLPKGRINVTDRRTDGHKILAGRDRPPDPLKRTKPSKKLRLCSMFAVLGQWGDSETASP